MISRNQLLLAAQSLCDDFASNSNIDKILSHFSNTTTTSAFEYGQKFLAPFLGRSFIGLGSIRSYFELLKQCLTFKNMHFSGYVVDVDERKVAVKGQAEFTWKSTGQKWDETFAYVLDFDEEAKVVRYQVWADSGAAYLAKIGGLDKVRKGGRANDQPEQ